MEVGGAEEMRAEQEAKSGSYKRLGGRSGRWRRFNGQVLNGRVELEGGVFYCERSGIGP